MWGNRRLGVRELGSGIPVLRRTRVRGHVFFLFFNLSMQAQENWQICLEKVGG
jgi:hypothetical protein